ncbi:MAG: hypothetical protein DRN17_03400 [Thermoplasmata archaeon]|nr:MAG: hypothetical protein DRN17_03400 [Thermoplasmata archaeon]
MVLKLDRDTVKRAVEDYVVKNISKEIDYEINIKKTLITKGGLVEITIERKQEPLPFEEAEGDDEQV